MGPMLVRISWVLTVVGFCFSIGMAFVFLLIGVTNISSASLDQNLNQLPIAQQDAGNRVAMAKANPQCDGESVFMSGHSKHRSTGGL